MQARTLLLFVCILIIWRIALFGLSWSADYLLPYHPSFPYSKDVLATLPAPRAIYSFANFDGVHYLTIIEKGYLGTGLIQAFFPMYPLLSRVASWISVHRFWAALLVTHLALAGAIYYLLKLLPTQHGQSQKVRTVLCLLLFPTAFFLGSLYSESLFLMFVLASFWHARSQKWLLAGVFAALASATRVVGIALVPALLVEFFTQYTVLQKSAKPSVSKLTASLVKVCTDRPWQLASIILGATGLFSYMLYLKLTFGDWLYFLHVQSEFGANRSESLVWYPQVVWRYIKILLTARPFDAKYFSYVQEFVAGTVGLLAVIISGLKTRKSYLVFSVLAFIVPTLTGTFSSMPRYLLACFPLFLYGGSRKMPRPAAVALLAISAALLIINTILFVQGYWVA